VEAEEATETVGGTGAMEVAENLKAVEPVLGTASEETTGAVIAGDATEPIDGAEHLKVVELVEAAEKVKAVRAVETAEDVDTTGVTDAAEEVDDWIGADGGFC